MERVQNKLPLREVRLRVYSCIGVVMLSIDAVNPVKVVCSILNISPNWVGYLAVIGFVVVIWANVAELAYFCVKVFLQSILTIFFSSVEVLGKQNIPEHGPIIFAGNHSNQFVDAAVMIVTTPHRVGLLMAEKSFHKRVIGDLAPLLGCIPVTRPQDHAKKGTGLIMMEGLKLFGKDGADFTKFGKGVKLLPGRRPDTYRVKTVVSATEAIMAEDAGEASPLTAECQGQWVTYDVLEAVDQGKMFDAVNTALSKGNCLGIFPEGGSHDQTNLLPLKAGVAIIALSVLEKYDVSVPIVPVGLNYFRGHRFRGRVVVEYGEPIIISKETFKLYKQNKRQAAQNLLTEVEEGLRSVIVTASDYPELKLIHTIRRLYQGSSSATTTRQKQDLARRFSVAATLIKEKHGDKFPDDVVALKDKVEAYQETLDEWGLKDYQINDLEITYSKLLYTFLHALFVMTLASVPSMVLNAPVGLLARLYANKEAAKDLKASRVKITARDVVLSKKIVFSIMAVPVLWVTYALLLCIFTSWEKRTIFVLFAACPIFSYIGVMAVEKGILDLKDLRPVFLRLMPAFRRVALRLPETRLELQREVRAMVKKYGPPLGPVYYDKSGDWEKGIIMSGSSSNNSNPNAAPAPPVVVAPATAAGDSTSSSSTPQSAVETKKDN